MTNPRRVATLTRPRSLRRVLSRRRAADVLLLVARAVVLAALATRGASALLRLTASGAGLARADVLVGSAGAVVFAALATSGALALRLVARHFGER